MDSIKGDPSMALGGASTVAKVPFIKCIDKFIDAYNNSLSPGSIGPKEV